MMNHTFIRFLLVGILNTIIGLTVTFVCLNGFLLPYWTATFTGNSIGAAASFFLNKKFTFQSTVKTGPGMARFILVILVCYFFSYQLGLELSKVLLETVRFSKDYTDEAAVLFGSGFYTISNYFGQKFFVFRKALQKGQGTI